MTMNNPSRRFTPMSQLATDYPVLLIDSDAPLRELHNCVSERLNAVLKYLNLMACTSLPDYAENDINTVTNIARILVQDIADVFAHELLVGDRARPKIKCSPCQQVDASALTQQFHSAPPPAPHPIRAAYPQTALHQHDSD